MLSTDLEKSLAERPVSDLRGVGPRSQQTLAKMGIESVLDLLLHLPSRYQDRSRIRKLGTLRMGDEAIVEGEIQYTQLQFGRRRSLLVYLSDGSGHLWLRFFHFSKSQQEGLKDGLRIRCYGEVRRVGDRLEMIHPEYLACEGNPFVPTQTLTAVYPTIKGMSQRQLRNLIQSALNELQRHEAVEEFIPQRLLIARNWPSLAQALLTLHQPSVSMDQRLLQQRQHPAQRRLQLEELLAHHLVLKRLRARARKNPAPVLIAAGLLQKRLRSALPFELTQAQQRVIKEIQVDLDSGVPMLRLVQGDVGSGKTLVAAAAALQAIEAGYQVAVMAPTELLAEQHLSNFRNWLQPMDIRTGWLAGSLKGLKRKEQLERIENGDDALVVGTHALFQDAVEFNKLGLVIVDEQHRFGVHQRLSLRNKGKQNGLTPHQLVMTATPIPRTLAMTFYADLDVSIIDEMPKGRQPIETVVVPHQRRDEVIERIRQGCAEGRQVYWVCPLIDESELLEAQAANPTYELLSQSLADFSVGLVHGRMKAQEKDAVMQRFKAGEIQVLVATTVIEVGVDVPNASLMVIENAERLGLSQLHQLRGRVGRGNTQSSCVLLYQGKLSQTGKQRLAVMRNTNDGFVIAEKDLELRGPGEFLGTKQTGDLRFRLVDLTEDAALIPVVQKLADELIRNHPQSIAPLIRRWVNKGLQYRDV
ncbi:MAG: ATP-dependent DNA helicase RecG [Gammaproteobacteria bacterium]|nr:ATP-dependent DNA helicase RecG [Gammaproteobacteria bacterium]